MALKKIYSRAIYCKKCERFHYEKEIDFIAHQLHADKRGIFTRGKMILTKAV